jgi:hypothetical protein
MADEPSLHPKPTPSAPDTVDNCLAGELAWPPTSLP